MQQRKIIGYPYPASEDGEFLYILFTYIYRFTLMCTYRVLLAVPKHVVEL